MSCGHVQLLQAQKLLIRDHRYLFTTSHYTSIRMGFNVCEKEFKFISTLSGTV